MTPPTIANPNVQAAVQSKTVWASVATIVLGLVSFAAAHGLLPAPVADQLKSLVGPAVTVAAGVLALYGRWRVDIPTLSGWFKVQVQTPAARAALLLDLLAKGSVLVAQQVLPPGGQDTTAIDAALGKTVVRPSTEGPIS